MNLKQPRRTTRIVARATYRVVIASVMIAAVASPQANASDSDLTSDQVALEIERVQGIADSTAERWAEAQLRSEALVEQLAAAEARLADTTARYTALQNDLAQIAVDRYTGSSNNVMPLIFGRPGQQLEADALRSVALDQGAEDLDLVDSIRSDLDDARTHATSLRDQNTALNGELAQASADLDVQLSQLEALREHLKDEEVKRAYEALLAEQRREEAERQARAAAATTTSPPTPVKGAGVQSTPTSPADPVGPDTATPSPPTTTPPPPPVVRGGGWLCPVAGPNAFGDTWGAPRSGGRTHEGVDMMSPAGTPLVAVVAGSVTMKTNALGGNVVWLIGVDGAKYYYAHLSAWEGGSRGVSAGEVIGYVGRTGNTTANHLHFEIHPGGGSAVNPYPTVRQYC